MPSSKFVRTLKRGNYRSLGSLPFCMLLMFSLSSLSTVIFHGQAVADATTEEVCDQEVCHVKIMDGSFFPSSLVIQIGTTVVWTNYDDRGHTITSGSQGDIKPPLKSGLLKTDESYEFTFHASGGYEGVYKYFDQVTKTMRGQIIVQNDRSVQVVEEEEKDEIIMIDHTDPASGIRDVSLDSGTVGAVAIDPGSNSLLLELENLTNDGMLHVTLARDLIDATGNGEDGKFLVFIKKATSPSEVEGFYEEITQGPEERTLEIFVPDLTEEVRIVGTHVVPEFPIISVLVLAVGTSGVVALARFRYRL